MELGLRDLLDHLGPYGLALGLVAEAGQIAHDATAGSTYQVVDRDDLGVCCRHVEVSDLVCALGMLTDVCQSLVA